MQNPCTDLNYSQKENALAHEQREVTQRLPHPLQRFFENLFSPGIKEGRGNYEQDSIIDAC